MNKQINRINGYSCVQAQVKMQLNFQNVINARVTCLRTHFIPPPHPKILYETLCSPTVHPIQLPYRTLGFHGTYTTDIHVITPSRPIIPWDLGIPYPIFTYKYKCKSTVHPICPIPTHCPRYGDMNLIIQPVQKLNE